MEWLINLSPEYYFYLVLFILGVPFIWRIFPSISEYSEEQSYKSDDLLNSYNEWTKGKETIERKDEEIKRIINYITDENIKSVELNVFNNEIIHLMKDMYQKGLNKGTDPVDIITDIDHFIGWSGSNGVDSGDMESLLMVLRDYPYETDLPEIEYDIENEKVRRPTIPQNVKDKVWNRDGGKCVQCGSNENIEFDHIIPFSKGGSSTYRNLQILCEKCNRSKSSKIG